MFRLAMCLATAKSGLTYAEFAFFVSPHTNDVTHCLSIYSLKGDVYFSGLRQGEKTSSIEVGESKKFIVINATTEAILILVVSVSTIVGRCFLALVLFHLLYYLSLLHTRDILHARL